jgi:hypothetical protein
MCVQTFASLATCNGRYSIDAIAMKEAPRTAPRMASYTHHMASNAFE